MAGNLARERPGEIEGAQIPAGDRSECITAVRETELPQSIQRLADEYDRRIGDRDRFLWKWIHNLFDAFTLPCVPDAQWDRVKSVKTALTMYVTILDDLADRRGDEATFEQARRFPHTPEAVRYDAPEVDGEVVALAGKVWDVVKTGLRAGPQYEAFAPIFRFDLRQVLNAMEYSQLLNENRALANLTESEHHGPFNMVMFPYADIDLMWSPAFERTDLGNLRSLLLELQQMARIGNWITTWERELYEDDYTAGVVVEALDRGIITREEEPAVAVSKIQDHEIQQEFETEWEMRYAAAAIRDHGIESFDSQQLVEGMRTVMQHHIASYGHK
jgi:hypothetical protein